MKTDVGVIKAVEPVSGAAPRTAGDGRTAAVQSKTAPDLDTVRLVIEEDRQSGSFVYKTLDRVTGELLNQYPREEILRMLSREDYAAGDVIKTRA